MVSPQLIRRYPFFAGLTHDQISTLAKAATEDTVAAGHYFFRAGDKLNDLYFVIDGRINIVIGVPVHNENNNTANVIMGDLVTEDITVSTIGPGELFAWSALIPPHRSTAGAVAGTSCRVVSFASEDLFTIFRNDCNFGYLMLEKVAGVIRQRLRDMHIQSLAFVPA